MEPVRRSELLKALLANQMSSQAPMTTGLSGAAGILSAVLAARGIKNAQKDEKHADSVDSSNLAYTLAKQFAPQTQITLDGLPGEQPTTTSVNSAPVTSTPQYNALKGMPKEALQTVLMNQMFGKGEGYTLGKDEIRYDAANKPVATGPIGSNAPKPELKTGEVNVDGTWKPGSVFEIGGQLVADVKGKRYMIGTDQFRPYDRPGVTVNTGDLKAPEWAAKTLETEFAALRDSRATLPGAKTAVELLDKGMITGTGADFRLWLSNLGATMGVSDPLTAANTQQYVGLTANILREKIKALGSGTAISNADLLFTKATTGSDITQQKQALKAMVKLYIKETESRAKGYNERRDNLTKQYPELGAAYPNIVYDEPTPEQKLRSEAGLSP